MSPLFILMRRLLSKVRINGEVYHLNEAIEETQLAQNYRLPSDHITFISYHFSKALVLVFRPFHGVA